MGGIRKTLGVGKTELSGRGTNGTSPFIECRSTTRSNVERQNRPNFRLEIAATRALIVTIGDSAVYRGNLHEFILAVEKAES